MVKSQFGEEPMPGNQNECDWLTTLFTTLVAELEPVNATPFEVGFIVPTETSSNVATEFVPVLATKLDRFVYVVVAQKPVDTISNNGKLNITVLGRMVARF